jgi:REP element-mobilizing transposase RayT
MPFDRRTTPISNDNCWYSRGYLPRCDATDKIQSISYRLYDAVPQAKVESWRLELEITADMPQLDVRQIELRRRIAKYEDIGCGVCWLRKPVLAGIVEENLLHFDGQRYHLLAWCIMPNHVHVMFEKLPGYTLGAITHSWKSFTAKKINTLLGRTGEVWEREGFDRFIRNDVHYDNVKKYIEQNPVSAGLVKVAEEWHFSSAAKMRQTG